VTDVADADTGGVWTGLTDDALKACDALDADAAALQLGGFGQRPELMLSWLQLCQIVGPLSRERQDEIVEALRRERQDEPDKEDTNGHT
jgi:hypothetical protein